MKTAVRFTIDLETEMDGPEIGEDVEAIIGDLQDAILSWQEYYKLSRPIVTVVGKVRR